MIICFCDVEMWNKAISGDIYGDDLEVGVASHAPPPP